MQRVIVLGNNYVGSAFSDIYEVWDAEILNADTEKWDTLLKDVSHIIYAIDNKSNCLYKNWKDNYESLYKLFKYGQTANIKIILISTADLYGNNWDWDNQTREDSTHLDMNNDYRLSKRVAERMLKNSQSLILRIKNPFDNRISDHNVLYTEQTKDILYGWQDSYTYLPDLVNSTKYLIDHDHSGTYNIVQPQAASIVYIYKNVLKIPKYMELDGDAAENSEIDSALHIDRVYADVNSTKIQELFPLTPLDAAVSLAWEKIRQSI